MTLIYPLQKMRKFYLDIALACFLSKEDISMDNIIMKDFNAKISMLSESKLWKTIHPCFWFRRKEDYNYVLTIHLLYSKEEGMTQANEKMFPNFKDLCFKANENHHERSRHGRKRHG